MNNTLDIYRQGLIIATIDIDENTVFNGKLPGTELITCSISNAQILNLLEEDYIIHRGAAYKIRILPDFEKNSETLARTYKINFLARFYDLLDTYVQHLGSRRFSYYGNAAAHLQVLINSANLNDSGWVIGNVDATTELNLDYDWTFIRPALDQIAEAFKLEWNAVGTTINMVATVGSNTGLVFEVGKGKGLHQINRSSDTSKEKINRVYGIGGTRNIDSTYRGGLEPNLVFQERYVETPGVTAGVERVREGKYENLELFPKFEGIVNGVTFVADNTGKITSVTIQDPNIDFDLMANLQDGVKPKVSFLTGPVTGIEFEISAFSLPLKTVTVIPFTDTSGYYFPSSTSKPEIGDKFTFIDIRMPNSYKVVWENKLKAETLTFLNENKAQRLIYAVKPDEKHLRDNLILLKCGDRATAIETEIGVNEILRFTEISYPLVNEYDVTGVIGNEIVFDKSVKQYAAVLNNIKQIAQITAKGIIQSKRAAQALRQLEGSIFDTDGKFDSAKLNVGVLTVVLGIFGVKSQNFVLSNVRMVDNVGGDANSISISGGQLIHLELSNAGAGGDTWTMTALSQSGLTAASLYYIYAKCSKASQVGSWVVATSQIKPDDVPGFYHFLAGVIYPVNNGFRDTEFTYGITDITGNRIKTGTIAGRNGALEINLETGTIKGDITFVGSSLSNINNIQSTANLGVTNAANALGLANTANTAANLAVSNAAAVQLNLTSLQNGLGGLAYQSAVELAQLGNTIISGGYIKANLLDVNAIVVTGSLATQTYANTVANTAGSNALSAAQTYALQQATAAQANAIANAATNAFAQSYAAGKMLYRDPEFALGLNGINPYNNAGGGLVQISRGTNGSGWFGSSIPNGSNCYINIDVYPGSKDPGLGGFYFATQTRANAIFIVRIMALIPVGYSLNFASNAGALSAYQTDVTGSGAWKEYLFVIKCPPTSAGGFLTTNFFYLTGADARLAWSLASATVYDMTAKETDPLAYADTKAIATINAAQTYADSVATSKANIAQTTAISSASADATAKANAARTNAVDDSQLLINSISIGSVNVLPYSNILFTNPNDTGTGTPSYIAGGLPRPYFEVTAAAGKAVSQYRSISNVIFDVNVDYTISVWLTAPYASSNISFYVGGGSLNSMTPGVTTIINTTWKQVSCTFNTAINTVDNLILISNQQQLFYRDFKIEKGTKATDWSPAIIDVQTKIDAAQTAANTANTAYANLTAQLKSLAFQDVVEAAKLGSTVITGGLINTNLLDVGYIKANVLVAQDIEALNIVSKSIKTANSGNKRVEIIQSTNNIILYDAANNVLVEVDDDSALESISIQPNDPPYPPTINYNYGPGIKVGNFEDLNGGSSIGRTQISTNGKLAVYNKTTKAKVFDVEENSGNTNVRGILNAFGDAIFNGPVKVNDNGNILTGWSGFVVIVTNSSSSRTYINTSPTIPPGSTYVKQTYVKGVLVNIEGQSA